MSADETAALSALKAFLIGRTGLAYYEDKEDALAEHVRRRMAGTRVSGVRDYLALISGPDGRDELDMLIDDIAIGETYFFRFPAQFEALRESILPERISAEGGRRALRIWSAGCATGAEPYSVAILIEREWPDVARDWTISIIGTDICARRLERARAARFTEWELRGLPPETRAACFAGEGRHAQLLPRYSGRVTFRQHNLKDLVDAAPSPADERFDVILCRNVLIYFDMDLVRRVLARLRDMLAEGGWLLVGHAEPFLEISHFLTPCLLPGTTAYRKLDSTPETRVPAVSPADHGASHAPLGIASPESEWQKPPGPRPSVVPPASPPPPQAARPAVPSPTESASTQKRPSPEDSLERARALANRGDWPRAQAACEAHVQQAPLDPDGHFVLALIAEHSGDSVEAVRKLRQVLYLDRGYVLAHFHLARLLAHQRDGAAARRCYANVIGRLADGPGDRPVRGGDGLTNRELLALSERHLARLER